MFRYRAWFSMVRGSGEDAQVGAVRSGQAQRAPGARLRGLD